MYIDIHVNVSIYTYMFEEKGASTKKGEQQMLRCLFCKKKDRKFIGVKVTDAEILAPIGHLKEMIVY